MKQLIFKTNNSIAPLFLRIFLALVLFPHGAQKLFGWFGGYGFAVTMDYFRNTTGIPWILGFIVIVIEFFGPIALLLGAATRLWSIAICIVMTGIILTTFSQYFFMNWFGVQTTEGAEYFLLAIGMSLSLAMSGAGRYSMDASIMKSQAHYP